MFFFFFDVSQVFTHSLTHPPTLCNISFWHLAAEVLLSLAHEAAKYYLDVFVYTYYILVAQLFLF